ncbi:MAG: glycosyltransferase family 4 protein [Clostridia bacterium]|nr:glycosyltransferase family 4 protein [Clostridia bacterium]
MKVLITTDCYIPTVNGVVTSIINLKNVLSRLGHDVRILCPSQNLHCIKTENIYYMSSFSVNKIYPKARAAFYIRYSVMKSIIEWKPDIIHSQCEFTSFMFAQKIARTVNCPIVHTYHTVYENYTHYFSPNITIGKKAVSAFSRKILNKTESVIAPTKKIENLLKGYGVSKKINIVPTGININKFRNKLSDMEKFKLKSKLGIPKNSNVLISVGRVAKEKNIEELLYYYKRLNMKNTVFLIVGGGPYKEELERLADKLEISENVIFAGMINPENIAAYYQIGNVFLSASNSETQGLTYIEALASGLPAICKKDPCLDGVICHNENGFQYADYDTFADCVKRLISNKTIYSQISKKASFSAEKYSEEDFGKNIEKIYINTVMEYKK